MPVDVINITLIITAIINILLSTLVYFHQRGRNALGSLFSLLALSVGLWSVGMVLFRSADSHESLIAVKLLYAIAILIPALFVYFARAYVGIRKTVSDTGIKIVLASVTVLMISITFFSNLFLEGVTIPAAGEKIIFFGDWYVIYAFYFLTFFSLAFLILIKQYKKETSEDEKNRIKILLIGTVISSLFGLMTNLMLPWLGIFVVNWLGNVTTIIFAVSILYAVMKYQLFNLKIILTEVFSFTILILFFGDLFFAETPTELGAKTLVLVFIAVFNFLLIRSVYREVDIREEAEELAQRLRKANARLRELDRQKSEFVSITSHQLRTPLTAIKGYSSMLLDGSFGKLCKGSIEPVEKIYRSSQRLVGVVEDFLNVTRIEQGRMSYDFRPVDMHHICENVVEELSFGARDKGLDLIFTCGKPGAIVSADQGKIRQVALNLVDNAVKYTEKGKVEVCLRDDDPKHVVFEVVDTGIGIPEEFKKRMFEKFSRADNSGAYHANGSGIGLYIVKEIVEAHKGTISVDSKEGKGATFTVTLPRVKEETKKKT